jgi:tRNA(fMet)-specific endonuclease VapC
MDYILDTNILVIYVRASKVARNLEKDLGLFAQQNNLIVSAVTVGEIRSLAIQNKWGDRKVERLNQLLERFLIADINVKEIIEKYAEIDAFSQGKLPGTLTKFSARNMGKNDLWIAATGAVLNLVLVTTDSDFDHLNGQYLTVQKVDIKKYLEK